MTLNVYMAVPRPKVLIFGHSFISRLKYSIRESTDDSLRSDFKLQQCDVTLAGFGGLTVSRRREQFFRKVTSLFAYQKYDIVVFQLGSNDISHDTSPIVLAGLISDFATYLLDNHNVQIVYICQIFTRPRPRYITAERYSAIRNETNNKIEAAVEDYHRIKYWTHKRIFNSPIQLFCQDGVHLNAMGTKKLYKSLRQAVIFAVEDFKSI